MNVDEQYRALAQIRRLTVFLNPLSFEEKVAELRRGALPRSSGPGDSRGADRPIPEEDVTDRELRSTLLAYRSNLTKAKVAMEACERAQRSVLSAMGEYLAELDPAAAGKAMEAARVKATERLDQAEGKKDKFTCDVCAQIKKRTANQRPRSARIDALAAHKRDIPKPVACSACYQYGQDHPAAPTPPAVVLARRLEVEIADRKRKAC